MRITSATVFTALLFILLAAVPAFTVPFDQPFYLALARRVMIQSAFADRQELAAI